MVATVVLADGSGRVAAARVAVGSCSAVARRLPQLENDLIGAPVAELGARVRPEHLSVLSPIDDVRATADYRRDASITLIQRALNRCAEKR
jgi:CO/xanthine dehydrogenase FAD-binding subunit